MDNQIEAGDFIKARGCGFCCGIALERGSIPFGKKQRISGWMITLANGDVDFIDDDHAEMICMSEEHFLRVISAKYEAAA